MYEKTYLNPCLMLLKFTLTTRASRLSLVFQALYIFVMWSFRNKTQREIKKNNCKSIFHYVVSNISVFSYCVDIKLNLILK